MVARVETAFVTLWGEQVGAVAWLDDRSRAVFEYEPDFLKKGIDISPLHMGIDAASKGDGIFSFPALSNDTFLGLPGLLADALPDKFGNSIIDAWLARNGRDSRSFSPVERLCYTGRRGMGALEFSPVTGPRERTAKNIQIDKLVDLASEILTQRNTLDVSFSEKSKQRALADILRVGTSAGGARAKALIAWNRKTNEVRSGQVDAGEEFLRELGLSGQIRVRNHKEIVRLEIEAKDLPRFMQFEIRKSVTEFFKGLGFTYITLDLEGYTMGSLNRVIAAAQKERHNGQRKSESYVNAGSKRSDGSGYCPPSIEKASL